MRASCLQIMINVCKADDPATELISVCGYTCVRSLQHLEPIDLSVVLAFKKYDTRRPVVTYNSDGDEEDQSAEVEHLYCDK